MTGRAASGDEHRSTQASSVGAKMAQAMGLLVVNIAPR
jgi:hypothetical protein